MKQILLSLLLLLPLAASADDSGECGSGLTYYYEEATNTLTISKTGEGTGKMNNYALELYSPWYSYREEIKTVVLKSGVTSIGDFAFFNCSGLTSVVIPTGVTTIGDAAFHNCI